MMSNCFAMSSHKCTKCCFLTSSYSNNNNSNFTHSKNSASASSNNFLHQQQHQRHVIIILLDDTVLDINVDAKSSAGDVLQRVCDTLQLKEYDIFGLAQNIRDEYHFVSNDEKLHKILINNSSTSTNVTGKYAFTNYLDTSHRYTNNFSFNSSPNNLQQNFLTSSSLTASNLDGNKNNIQSFICVDCQRILNETHAIFYFRVKFYVTDLLLLNDPLTRHLYYLQLRKNYLNINHRLSDERHFMLASLILCADHGPFNFKLHSNNYTYFDVNLCLPQSIINKLGKHFVTENMRRMHEQQSKRYHTQINAQHRFCSEVSNQDNGDECLYNLHLYNVYKNKEETPGTICLGIAPKGILVFDLRSQSVISLISTFEWPSITKLISDKKKFEITINADPKPRRYVYYTKSEKFSKYLLDLSKSSHAFTSNIFARLANQRTLANYVSESYNEKMLGLNESNVELFEEREIKFDATIISPKNIDEIDPKKSIETAVEKKSTIISSLEEKTNEINSLDTSHSSTDESSSLSYYETALSSTNTNEFLNKSVDCFRKRSFSSFYNIQKNEETNSNENHILAQQHQIKDIEQASIKASSYSHIYLNDLKTFNNNNNIYMNSSFVLSPLSLEAIPSSPLPQPLTPPESKASIEIDDIQDESNTNMSLQQEQEQDGKEQENVSSDKTNLFTFKSSNRYFDFASANNNLLDKKQKRSSLQDPILLNSPCSNGLNSSPYFKLNHNMQPILPISLTYRKTIATTTPSSTIATPPLSTPNNAINIEPSHFRHKSFYQTDSTQTSSSCPSVLTVTLRRPPNHRNDSSCSSSQDQMQYYTNLVTNSPKQINDYYLSNTSSTDDIYQRLVNTSSTTTTTDTSANISSTLSANNQISDYCFYSPAQTLVHSPLSSSQLQQRTQFPCSIQKHSFKNELRPSPNHHGHHHHHQQNHRLSTGGSICGGNYLIESLSASASGGFSSTFMPPYQKSRKPPSYEESLRKLKKHSSQSSNSSSIYNETSDSNKSLNSSLVEKLKIDLLRERSNTDSKSNNNVELIQKKQLNFNQASINLETTKLDNNDFTLSIENLEQIRNKASTLSLPLLTSLCTEQIQSREQSLLQQSLSLNRNNNRK